MSGVRTSRVRASVWSCLALTLTVVAFPGAGADPERGDETTPVWGRGHFRPTAANALFATGDGCVYCHSVSTRSSALRTADGEDGSPHGTWRGSMMANAFIDPYWRAQVARETAAHPDRAAEIEGLCQRCHAPMTHVSARRRGDRPTTIDRLTDEPLARDGVSCTVCHQIDAAALARAEQLDGLLDLRPERRIYGPYPAPFVGPMRMHTAYTPEHAPHVRASPLCATCHTLHTTAEGAPGPFPEQTPFLEWRNSVYSVESAPSFRSCRDCHLPTIGATRIARNPGGGDFPIRPRPDVRAHAFAAANTLVPALLREHRDDLGVTAPDDALAATAARAAATLAAAASLEVTGIHGSGDTLVFDVAVENRTGHKLPTGYPSRRVWLHVRVTDGSTVLFESGGLDDAGRLGDDLHPHRDVIADPDHVQVYELIATDVDGRPTTLLTDMVERWKDNRLLPRGWSAGGPHAATTAPRGTRDDDDFTAGRDVVTYRVPLPPDAAPGEVAVCLHYQPIPPRWVDPLRAVTRPDAERFVGYYDARPVHADTIARVVVPIERPADD